MQTKSAKNLRKNQAKLKLSTRCMFVGAGLLATASVWSANRPNAAAPTLNAPAPAQQQPAVVIQQVAPDFSWRQDLENAVANNELSQENQELIDKLMTIHVEAFTGTSKDFKERFQNVKTQFLGKDINAIEFKEDFWAQQDVALKAYAQWVWANALLRRSTCDWIELYDGNDKQLAQHIYDLCFKDESVETVLDKISFLAAQHDFPQVVQSLLIDLYTLSRNELLSTFRFIPEKVVSDSDITDDLIALQEQTLSRLNDGPGVFRLKGMTQRLEEFRTYRQNTNILLKTTKGRGNYLKIPKAKAVSFASLYNHEPKADPSLVLNLPVAVGDNHSAPSKAVWDKRLEKVRKFATQIADEGGIAMLGISDLHGETRIYKHVNDVAQVLAENCPLIVVGSGDLAARSPFARGPQRFESDTLIQFKKDLNHTAQGHMYDTFGNHDTQDDAGFHQFIVNWNDAANEAAQNHETFGRLISNTILGFRDNQIQQSLIPFVIDGNVLVVPLCVNFANGGLGEHEVPVLDDQGKPVLDEDGEPETDYVPMFTDEYTRALENTDNDRCDRDGRPNSFLYTYDGIIFQGYDNYNFAEASRFTTDHLKTLGLKSDDDDDDNNNNNNNDQSDEENDEQSTADKLTLVSRHLWHTGSPEAPGKINPVIAQTALNFTTGVRQLSQQNPGAPLHVVLAAHEDYLHLLHFFEDTFYLLPSEQRLSENELSRMTISSACGHMHHEYAIAKFFNIYSSEGEWVQVPSIMAAPGIYGGYVSIWNLGNGAHLSDGKNTFSTPKVTVKHSSADDDDDDDTDSE